MTWTIPKTTIDIAHIPWYHYCMINRRVIDEASGSRIEWDHPQALRLSPAPTRDESDPNYSGVEGDLLPVSVTSRVETGVFHVDIV